MLVRLRLVSQSEHNSDGMNQTEWTNEMHKF